MLGTNTEDLLGYFPQRVFFTLSEACELKCLSYKTAMNKPWLKPNGGKPEAIIGGRRVFTRETILNWIDKDDQTLFKEYWESEISTPLSEGNKEVKGD